MTAFDFECDADRMAALGNSSIALSASNAVSILCLSLSSRIRGALSQLSRKRRHDLYFDQECATGLTPSCYAYAEGIRRLCLCRKRAASRQRSLLQQQQPNAAQTTMPQQQHLQHSFGNPTGCWPCCSPVALVLTLTLATQSSAHNWVETPSRARSRASTTRPCQIRKASDLHAQIGKGRVT